MKRQAPIPAQKKTIRPQMKVLSPHTAVHNGREHEMPANASVESQFEHDFSWVSVQPSIPGFGQDNSNLSCPLLPQRGPFGGACYTCPPCVQAKLKIGQPADKYEKEADRIADQVMAMPGNSKVGGVPRSIQRLSGEPAGQWNTVPASVDQALASPGTPLEPSLQQDMEQRFGYDFSRVRVHNGTAAEKSTRDLRAYAYTVGHDIVFGARRFMLGTATGRRVLAHELTHVVQQSSLRKSSDEAPKRIDPAVGVKNDIVTADTIEVQNARPLEAMPVATVIQRTCESEALRQIRAEGRQLGHRLFRADDAVDALNSDPTLTISDLTSDLREFIRSDEAGRYSLNLQQVASWPRSLSEEERACFEEGFRAALSYHQTLRRRLPSPEIMQYIAAAIATSSAGGGVGGPSTLAGTRPRLPSLGFRGRPRRGAPGYAHSPLSLLLWRAQKTVQVRHQAAAAPAASRLAPPTPLTTPTTSMAGIAIGSAEMTARERVIPEMLPEREPLPSEEVSEIEALSEELWDPEQRERNGCAPPVPRRPSGGHDEHDAFAAHISGWPVEFVLTAPGFPPRSFDAMDCMGVLYEVKTHHDALRLVDLPDVPGPLSPRQLGQS